MWKLEDYGAIFVVVGLVGMLLIASPSLALIFRLPGGEKFSELWILGPGHMAEGYPGNVTAGTSYLVYVGVGNHMGSSAYYGVYVKFRNESDALPNSTAGTPSPAPSLYEYRVFVEDGKSWEAPLTFSFSNVSFTSGRSMVGSMTINDFVIDVHKPVQWNNESRAYHCQVFMELWIYNVSLSFFQYHNRYVNIRLNMTS